MTDYTSLGLNERMQSKNGLLERKRASYPGMQFDSSMEVQTKSIAISNFVAFTDWGYGSGTIADTETAIILSHWAVTGDEINFGLPYVAAYEGTSPDTDFQIYPERGGSIANQKYSVSGGFDASFAVPNDSYYSVLVENNSGAPLVLYVESRWRRLLFRSGNDILE